MDNDAHNVVEKAAEEVEIAVETANRITEPYRKSALKKFPVLFTLLVAFGASATIYGFERIIAETLWLESRPWLILFIGLLTLIITGSIYKKLG